MDDPVRLASVGLGSWAQVLADAAQRGDVIELVNCYSRNPATREAFQERNAIARAADSYEALLADPDVEGVVITTPNDVHTDQILAALDAGRSVYVDKPVAHTLQDALRLEGADEQAVIAVGQSARRLGGHRVMRELLDSGSLGMITLAEANFSNPRGLRLDPDEWRFHGGAGPDGVAMQLGVHHADTLQYLLGPVQAVSAWSIRRLTAANIPDVSVALLEIEDGVTAYLGSSWAAQGHYGLHLFGTEANLAYSSSLAKWAAPHLAHTTARLSLQKPGDEPPSELEVPATDMFREALEEFALALRGEASVEVGLADGMRALAVIEALALSASRGGARVELAEVWELTSRT